jgi:prepilin-type N-terminal cleavage/methylation domain-containing protein
MMPNTTDQFEKGFTLLEVVIAMAVLTVGILALFTMQTTSVRGNAKADRLTTASTWNIDQVEQFIGMQYADTTLLDNDGDGNGSTMGANGADTAGVNFGLDDIVTGTMTNADADGTLTTVDGRYTLFWNVAINVPMPNLKTIRVHVRDNMLVLSKPVAFTYIKADII